MEKKRRYGLLWLLVGLVLGVVFCLSLQALISSLNANSNIINQHQVGEQLRLPEAEMYHYSEGRELDALVVACLSAKDCDIMDVFATLDSLEAHYNGSLDVQYFWKQRAPANLSFAHANSSVTLANYSGSMAPPAYFLVDPDYKILFKTADLTEIPEQLTDMGLTVRIDDGLAFFTE